MTAAVMFLWGSLAVVASLAAASARDALQNNTNNVFSRATLNASNCLVVYLGSYDAEEDCIRACEAFGKARTAVGGKPPDALASASGEGGRCHAWTWHLPAFGPPWAKGCYGVTRFLWDPTREANVNSGKVRDGWLIAVSCRVPSLSCWLDAGPWAGGQ